MPAPGPLRQRVLLLPAGLAAAALAACGTAELTNADLPSTPAQQVVGSPNACALLKPADVKSAIGEQASGVYSVTSIATGGKSYPAVGQCTYAAPDGPAVVVTVFPQTKVNSLASYLTGGTPLGPAIVQESPTAGTITVQQGSSAIEIALDVAGIDQTTRTQRLVVLAGRVLGNAATLPVVTAAPTAAPSASSSAAVASGPGQKVSGQTAATKVTETDSLKFQPASTTAKSGSVVEWDNTSSVAHNVTFDDYGSLTSSTMNSGDTYQIEFTQPGTYQYHCTFHPGMNGSITVA